jgi:hypothetical protein
MQKKILEAIEEYQCSGCIGGPALSCLEVSSNDSCQSCTNHMPGTIDSLGRKIFLGMPKGFNIVGPISSSVQIIFIYENFQQIDFRYDKLNIPIWKYLNENGHTFVRGLSPRINTPFLHIILEDCIDKIDCLEISNEFLKHID